MKKTAVIVVTLIVVILIAVLANKNISSKSLSTTSVVTEKVFKLGAILPLTGPVASAGLSAKNGIEKAVKDLSQNGTKIEVIYEDGQYEAKASITAYNKLKTTDNVDALIVFGTPSTMPLVPLVNADRIPLIALTPAAAYTSVDDYTFRMIATASDAAKFAADFLTEKLGKKRIAVMYLNNEYGIGALASVKKLLGSRATIVAEDGAATGITDYRAQITKMKATNPDAVYLAMTYKEAGLFVKQAKEFGLNVPFIGDQPVDSPDFIATGGSATEGTLVISPTTASNAKFQEEFTTQYGIAPSYISVKMYDSIRVLSHVAGTCEKENYSGECVKNALYALKDFPGLSFPINYDKNGDINDQLVMRVVKGGKFVMYENK